MWKLAAIRRYELQLYFDICTFLAAYILQFVLRTLLVLYKYTSRLTSVPLGELQVLPLDAAGEEEVGLLLLGNVLYGHGGGRLDCLVTRH